MSNDITPNPDRLARAKSLDSDLAYAWETWADSFDVLEEIINEGYYVELGYETAIDYVREQLMPIIDTAKLTAAHRQPLVQALISAGFSNRAIASAVGVNEKQIRNDKKALEALQSADSAEGADLSAPNELYTHKTAGQSVETVGHIDENTTSLPSETADTTESEAEVAENPEPTEESEEERKARLDAWLDSIDFQGMIISTPTQIIEAEASEDTPEYFTPRSEPASWSPPAVQPLPPVKPTSYHDQQPEFLEPPMQIEKTQKPDDKHCKTCNCHLLP